MDKNSQISDAVGNLYRGAYYLAKDGLSNELGKKFIRKSTVILQKNKKYKKASKEIKELLKEYPQNNLLLAEKVLDKYHLLKFKV